jgi:hypothetical protein
MTIIKHVSLFAFGQSPKSFLFSFYFWAEAQKRKREKDKKGKWSLKIVFI